MRERSARWRRRSTKAAASGDVSTRASLNAFGPLLFVFFFNQINCLYIYMLELYMKRNIELIMANWQSHSHVTMTMFTHF